MSATIQSLGIDRLNVRERLELIDQIWDSLPETVEAAEVPAWHVAELSRRIAKADANPSNSRPWREVWAALEADK